LSRLLFSLLVQTFVPEGPLVTGVAETIERRWGRKITAKGTYRDAGDGVAGGSSNRLVCGARNWCRIQACAQDGLYRFLMTVGALKIIGGTGSPINPVVIK
jgi:hypothetical protein